MMKNKIRGNGAGAVIEAPGDKDKDVAEMIRLDIAYIIGFAHNPRRHVNPEYERIKASIQISGLDQPLVVTQRPDEADYVLHAGGNTRLRALKELFQETSQERFRWVHCQYVPWHQESDLLLAHLRENELRGKLYFIDKAQAVFEAKQMFEEELGVDTLTLRHLAALCREKGFHLNPGLISKLGYAAQKLLPLMPQALSAGLGRPQIEKIRALDRTASHLWEQFELGSNEAYDDIFSALCQRYDTSDWDIQPIKQALENEIALEADQSLQGIRMVFDAALAGRSLPVFDFRESGVQEFDDAELELENNTINEGSSNDIQTSDPEIEMPLCADQESTDRELVHRDTKALVSLAEPTTDLSEIRTKLYSLAFQLASNHGFGGLVVCLPDTGLGFLLSDMPSEELLEVLDSELLIQVSSLWWQLFAISEMLQGPPVLLTEHLDTQTLLHQAIEQHDIQILSNGVLTHPPEQMNCHLWRYLSDSDWTLLMQLMKTYRQYHQLADQRGIAIWVGMNEG